MPVFVNVKTPRSVTPEAKARLAAAIEDRANQTGWSYKRIATEAGVDVVTINALRAGDYATRPYRRTLRGLDRALRLVDGSCERILNGEEPIQLLTDPVASVVAEIEALPNLSAEQKKVLIGVLESTIRNTREQAQRLNEEQAS